MTIFGNTNMMRNGTGFRRCSQSTPVPQSSMSQARVVQQLSIPNGEVVPMGCENSLDILPHINPDIHQCPDGTLISKSTGRILRDNTKTAEFPGSMLKRQVIGQASDWNSRDGSFDNNGLTIDDIRYIRMSEVESRKLRDNMTDEQKRMLSDLENGKIFKLSKQKDEN